MFRQTLIKLAALNSLILFCLISLLGGTIYIYERTVLYQGSDEILTHASGALASFNGGALVTRDPRLRDPRLSFAILNQNNEVLFSDKMDSLTTDTMKSFLTKTTDQIVEKRVAGYYFHVLVNKIYANKTTLTVYFIINVDPERNLLNTLLSIIWAGLGFGTLLSVVLGYVLARWALRPIQNAWDKQNRFVADASHELRTPLSIIQLKTEGLLRQPKRSIQDTGEDIAVMLDEIRRLSKLVGSLLTLARSDANRLEVNLGPLDLTLMLKKVTEPFAEMADFDEKTFELKLDKKPVIINGDEQRIHQLLVILLDNAMKFTNKGGKIAVSCSQDNKTATLSVSDSGIGISEKDLPHIFDRFFQADASRTDRKGTGLGLAIAQWIVEKHRGRIEADSRPGKGTVFTVHLPLMKKEDKVPQLLRAGEKRRNSNKNGKGKANEQSS